MSQRLILDIDSKKNTDILIGLLKNVNFIKHIETQVKPEITGSEKLNRAAFEMSSKSLRKFLKNETNSIF